MNLAGLLAPPFYIMQASLHHNQQVNTFAQLRVKQWLKHYPNCLADIEEVFGEIYPPVSKLASWKCSWYDVSPYQFTVGDKSIDGSEARMKVQKTTEQVGVHPYFWDFWHHIDNGPTVSFFKEEHLVMFKLGWNV